jgi:hypothetical protein
MVSFLALTKAKASTDLKIAEMDQQIAETQKVILDNSQLPHRVYGASLKHDGLEWICCFGYDETGNPVLVGRGDTPSRALIDFDHKWYGLETPE